MATAGPFFLRELFASGPLFGWHPLPVPILLHCHLTRAAVAEEFLFRGYGLERLQELTGSKWIAGLLTLAIFTYGHLSYWVWHSSWLLPRRV
jgi:membrane protease YdiL (CAAX protease family)